MIILVFFKSDIPIIPREKSSSCRHGATTGTPRYMAPEAQSQKDAEKPAVDGSEIHRNPKTPTVLDV